MLDAEIKHRWEAAAQAVLERCQAQPRMETPREPLCRWCGQPRAVHPTNPAWRCRLSDGPRLPQGGDDDA